MQKLKKQEKLDIAEERNSRREELLGKYTAKILYRWNNRKFENEYLRKLEKNQKKQKGKNKTIWREKTSSSRVGTLKGR